MRILTTRRVIRSATSRHPAKSFIFSLLLASMWKRKR